MDRQGNIRVGRAQSDKVISFLGENSFDQGETKPWATLLQNSTTEFGLGSAISTAWLDIQQSFDATDVPRNSNLLVGQPVERAGFFKDGKLPHSVTHTVSKEIDKAIITQLLSTTKETATSTTTSISTQAEVVAFQNVDRFSAAFLTSLPNRTGFFTDPFFADAMAQYLGLPLPSLAHVTDHYRNDTHWKTKYPAHRPIRHSNWSS